MSQLAGHFLGQALAKYFIVLSNNPSSTLSSAIQKLCVKLADGHTCIDLEEIDDNQQPCSLEELRSALFYSGVVSAPGKIAPFILDEKNRFYFYRYYFYEQRLSELLVKRILQKPQVDKTRIRQLLDELFVSGQPWPNLQKVAAALAVTNQFCIVTGGPGTGKTSTLTRIILLLLRFSDIPLNIKLAAPTGKAAQRMQESIRAQIISLHDPERLPFGFPEKASTIHSLLGARSDGVSFYHDANRPLECDVLIIDEASMIDVALMYRIMEALPLSSRLIIVGDPYQLASVEAGSVLTQLVDEGGFDFERVSDIEAMTGERVNPGTKPNFLSQCHIALTQSYRFNEKSGIGKLCLSVNEGEFGKVKALLDDPVYSDISSLEWTGWSGLESFIFNGYKNYVETVMHGPSNLSENIFKIFSEFRLICAIRDGNQGVIGANTAIENILMHHGLIVPRQGFYIGRPVLILKNDPFTGLSNGDIGITVADSNGKLCVCFEGADGSYRQYSPGRLPPHETAWAMTIHKCQGSEFDSVLLLLPRNMLPVMTRSLLYTGISRARKQVLICGMDCLEEILANAPLRQSGIRSTLLSM